MPGNLVEQSDFAWLAQEFTDDVLDGGEFGCGFTDNGGHKTKVLDAVELGIPLAGGYRLLCTQLLPVEPMLGDVVERRLDSQKVPSDAHEHGIAQRIGIFFQAAQLLDM